MKVLVVDDHAYNRELLGFILEEQGYDYTHAENGKVACEKVAEDSEIAAVLMDVMMPVMDGIEATRNIKSSIGNRFLPIILVTALEKESNLSDCLNAGGDDFISKPINETVLTAKLKAHARSKKLYDSLTSANKELNYRRSQMDREHSVVEHIFKNGSARTATYCENIESYTSPMSMFNGDLVLIAPTPSGGVYGVIGDFTGHGLASSIGSLPVTEVFFNAVAHQASVSQLASDINHRLKILLPQNMFFCAAIFELDRSGENMTLWMGGMNDMLVMHTDKSQLSKIESEHMPLGILGDEEFDDSPRVVDLKKVAKLVLYTDGITEAQNTEREEFGEMRLEQIVEKYPSKLIETVLQEVNAFTEECEQSDDVSILSIVPGKIVHRSKDTKEIEDVGASYNMVDSIPWNLNIELQGEDLKSTNVVDQVMSFVSSIKGIELHQDRIFTIVSELYNNSLEHGVLGLSSSIKQGADGFEKYYSLREERLGALADEAINIEFNYVKGSPNKLELIIKDSGPGFEHDALSSSLDGDEFSHGRGIQLLTHLCSSLTYSESGTKVRALYELREH